MRTKKTIIIENRLAEMFEYLPMMSNDSGVEFKHTFMYGDEKQLNDFLRQNQSGKSMYPLIWLIYPFTESHNVSNVSYKDMQLVLAVETNSSILNSQRMQETYSKVLLPLLDNIRMLFQRSNIINNSKEYKLTKFPNYSEVDISGEVNKTLYIWDALKISFDGYITSNCLKPVFF